MKYFFYLAVVTFVSSCTYNELSPLINDCQPSNEDFLTLVQPIIESSCLECHDGSSSGQDPVLITYEDVIDAINNHGLINEVTFKTMPPAWSNYPELTSLEIESITNWNNCE